MARCSHLELADLGEFEQNMFRTIPFIYPSPKSVEGATAPEFRRAEVVALVPTKHGREELQRRGRVEMMLLGHVKCLIQMQCSCFQYYALDLDLPHIRKILKLRN